jgi:adenosylhomocysteine nucleosidase
MTIAIIGAMPEEITAVQTKLTQVTHTQIGGIDFYQGSFNHTNIVLVCSGIGKVHAALATGLLMQKYQPSCVINVGTLGALETHLQPTAIILLESVLYHDVDLTHFNYVHGQIPKMPPDYQASQQLLRLFEQLALKQNLLFYRGLGVTGDQFVGCKKTLQHIKQKFPTAIGIDMEAAAIAQVTHLFHVPFISIRSITDHADENAAAIWDVNLTTAADIAGNFVLGAVDKIAALLDA